MDFLDIVKAVFLGTKLLGKEYVLLKRDTLVFIATQKAVLNEKGK